MEASLILFTSDVHNLLYHNKCNVNIVMMINVEFVILMYVSLHVRIWIKPMVNFLFCSGEY